MKTAHFKNRARKILEYTGYTALAVSLTSTLIRLVLVTCMAFCTYSAVMLEDVGSIVDLSVRTVLLYLLFILGAAISLGFFILTGFAQRRWYYFNSKSPAAFKRLFAPAKVSVQFKLVFIKVIKAVFTLGIFLFYLLPFTAVTFITLDRLSQGGVEEVLFMLLVSLAAVTLVTGLFFAFATIQRYSFCDELIVKHPSRTIPEIINESKAKTNGRCFELAKFRLSFVPWFAACVLIVPLVFVIPFYRQTFAVRAKKAIDKKHLSPAEDKPFIILSLLPDSI